MIATDGGKLGANIVVTDGISPPSPYLDPPSDSWYGLPIFAHSHIAWMRGVNPTQINLFERVELWASPYTADPAQLKPQKVSDWPDKYFNINGWAGAFGTIAVVTTAADGTSLEDTIWNLDSMTTYKYAIPPAQPHDDLRCSPGVTHTHSYVQKWNTIMRFALK